MSHALIPVTVSRHLVQNRRKSCGISDTHRTVGCRNLTNLHIKHKCYMTKGTSVSQQLTTGFVGEARLQIDFNSES